MLRSILHNNPYLLLVGFVLGYYATKELLRRFYASDIEQYSLQTRLILSQAYKSRRAIILRFIIALTLNIIPLVILLLLWFVDLMVTIDFDKEGPKWL